MVIVNDYARNKFLLYKTLFLIPSVFTLITDILRNKHDKFYVASSYIKYIYANRTTKNKVISIVAVTVHVFISNVVFFFIFLIALLNFGRQCLIQ